jgi:hypothetical protein
MYMYIFYFTMSTGVHVSVFKPSKLGSSNISGRSGLGTTFAGKVILTSHSSKGSNCSDYGTSSDIPAWPLPGMESHRFFTDFTETPGLSSCPVGHVMIPPIINLCHKMQCKRSAFTFTSGTWERRNSIGTLEPLAKSRHIVPHRRLSCIFFFRSFISSSLGSN